MSLVSRRSGSPSSDVARAQARHWKKQLDGYRATDLRRGLLELAVTALPFALLWSAALLAVKLDQLWLYALLLVPAAGLLVRLFVIQHDCGHGSFFGHRRSDDWTGRVIGVLTLTPYDDWKRSHDVHHASSGNLHRRGIGDILTLTVDEYLARSAWGRTLYRFYRNPVVMFGIGPLYMFLLQSRLPLALTDRSFRGKGWSAWTSATATNLAIAAGAALLMWVAGVVPFLLVHMPIVALGAAMGVWLFYMQHQFERTHWIAEDDWDFHVAALHGSSHYDLPAVLRWFTANIGMHHVHHLCSRIPSYRLPEAMRDHPELRDIGRLTLWQSLRCVKLALWDKRQGRLISFKEMAALYG